MRWTARHDTFQCVRKREKKVHAQVNSSLYLHSPSAVSQISTLFMYGASFVMENDNRKYYARKKKKNEVCKSHAFIIRANQFNEKYSPNETKRYAAVLSACMWLIIVVVVLI